MLQRIRIVLVNPKHPGNIGAVARAMKNMGLTHLSLVDPVEFPHAVATARAAGADDILAKAQVCADLTEALTGCHYAYALSARSRTLSWPQCDPRECARQIASQAPALAGIVFGRERNGLTNEELAQCHYHVAIPADPNFSSLNLAAAVQVMAYELRYQALALEQSISAGVIPPPRELATAEQIQGFFEHIESTLTKLEILDPAHPKMLMLRIQRLFLRAELDVIEINILRGFLKAVNKRL